MATDEQANAGGEDLYSDGPAEPKPDDAAEKPEEGAEDKGDSVEAVLPRSILAGKTFNVGDEVVLKITAMRDDQISVAYAPAKGKDEGGEEAPEAEAPSKPEGGSSLYD